MKLYVVVHSNNKSAPGAWSNSYQGNVGIVSAFTSVEDVRTFLSIDESPEQAEAMRKAWQVVEIDLSKSEPFSL